MNTRPQPDEYAPHFTPYIELVPAGEITELLGQNSLPLDSVTEEASLYRYAPDKWSIREVVCHVSDTERVFAYRAFWFARGLATDLPGIDENAAVTTSGAHERDLSQLLAEFTAVRAATFQLFRNLPAEAWSRTGTAAGYDCSVRALAHLILGHQLHHQNILRDRYAV